jgi:hypothetical protein
VPCSIKNLLGALIVSLALVSCVTAPVTPAAPLWVTDKEAAYPDAEWLSFVEVGVDRTAAEAAAMNTLAQFFRVDIAAATVASQTLVSRAGQNNKGMSASAEYGQFARNVTTLSRVSGLFGMEKDFWTAPDAVVYAIVRMNRAESAARYRNTIEENERLIELLTKKAEEAAGTFESLTSLRLAESAAELTDNLYTILAVVHRAAQRPAYGSAAEVRLLRREASRLISVELRVNGDVDGRIARAFSAVLSERGFLTAPAGRYVLEADFRLEDSPQTDAGYVFVRYALDGVLKNRDGTELAALSENGREGHLRRRDAEQRALRAVEGVIAGKGFAEKLDAYLDSLW